MALIKFRGHQGDISPLGDSIRSQLLTMKNMVDNDKITVLNTLDEIYMNYFTYIKRCREVPSGEWKSTFFGSLMRGNIVGEYPEDKSELFNFLTFSFYMDHWLQDSIDLTLTDESQSVIKYGKDHLSDILPSLNIDGSIASAAVNEAAKFIADMMVGKSIEQIQLNFRIPAYQLTS